MQFFLARRALSVGSFLFFWRYVGAMRRNTGVLSVGQSQEAEVEVNREVNREEAESEVEVEFLGCEDGHVTNQTFNVLTHHTNKSDTKNLFAMVCSQCKPGYREVTNRVSAPKHSVGLSTFINVSMFEWNRRVEEEYTVVVQQCEATPCGVDCTECETKKSMWGKRTYACKRCREVVQLPKLVWLVGGKQLFDETGADNKCERSGEGDINLAAQDASALMSQFVRAITSVATGIDDVLSLVQLLGALNKKAVAALKESLVGKSVSTEKQQGFQESFLKGLLQKAIDENKMATLRRQLSLKSRPLSQLAGAFDLCITMSLSEQGRQFWPAPASELMDNEQRCHHDAQWEMMRKKCTAIGGTFGTITWLVEKMIKEAQEKSGQVLESSYNGSQELLEPAYYDYQVYCQKKQPRRLDVKVKAPRKTVIDVLDLLGAYLTPQEALSESELQTQCGPVGMKDWLRRNGDLVDPEDWAMTEDDGVFSS